MFRYNNYQTVYINSKNRLNTNDTSSNFSVKINLDPNNKYDTFCIQSISIPKSFYMIDSKNNTFNLIEEGKTYLISLTPGNYSFTQLKTELQNLLNESTASTYTYVVTIPSISEPQTGKLTFSVSGNSSQPSLEFLDNKLSEILGFNKNTTYIFENDFLLSPNVVFLQRNENLLLLSDLVRPSIGSLPVVCQLFSNTNDFSYITFYCPHIPSYSKPLYQKQGIYNFLLCDQDGNQIDLNGVNFSFTILFYESNNTDEIVKKDIILNNLEKLK